MKKTFLILNIITLALGFSLLPLDSFALPAEEEKYVDSLLVSENGEEFDYKNCVSDANSDEFMNCLEASEDYKSSCETSDSEECEVSPDYNDGDEEVLEEDIEESSDDPSFIETFGEEGMEDVEEEEETEFDPASVIPVAVVVFLGLVIIIVLNLL